MDRRSDSAGGWMRGSIPRSGTTSNPIPKEAHDAKQCSQA